VPILTADDLAAAAAAVFPVTWHPDSPAEWVSEEAIKGRVRLFVTGITCIRHDTYLIELQHIVPNGSVHSCMRRIDHNGRTRHKDHRGAPIFTHFGYGTMDPDQPTKNSSTEEQNMSTKIDDKNTGTGLFSTIFNDIKNSVPSRLAEGSKTGLACGTVGQIATKALRKSPLGPIYKPMRKGKGGARVQAITLYLEPVVGSLALIALARAFKYYGYELPLSDIGVAAFQRVIEGETVIAVKPLAAKLLPMVRKAFTEVAELQPKLNSDLQ